MATPSLNVRAARTAHAVGKQENQARHVWAAARLSLCVVFLWAFFDKLLGLGHSTPPARAWINGGSPTMGFLGNTKGWFAGTFQAMAGNGFVDALFMIGLLGIGLALFLGIGMRIAAASGATLMALMYLAAVPGVPGTTNPLVDDHVVYALVLVGLAMVGAGESAGLGRWWSRLRLVRKYPILK